MKPSQLPHALELAWTTKSPAMLWGAAGIGKSQIMRQFADDKSVPYIDIRLSQMEPSDLSGIPWVVDGTTLWAKPEWFPTLEQHGPEGILAIDEITSAPPQMSAAAYQLVLERRIGGHVMPEGWLIIAAGNRTQDRGVVHSMPGPLANRLDHYHIEPDLDDLRRYAIANDWDVRIPSFLAFRPELLHSFDPRSSDPAFPSPRVWERLSDKLQAGIHPAILHEVVAGHIGKGPSIEFIAFLDMASKITTPDVILLNPDTAKLPTDAGVVFATMGALAAKTTPQNLSTALRYIDRVEESLGGEYAVLFMRDVTTADDSVQRTPAFIGWASDHAEVIL